MRGPIAEYEEFVQDLVFGVRIRECLVGIQVEKCCIKMSY